MAIRTPISKIAPAGDAYRLGLTTGLITILNAADPVFSMQWTSLTHRFILQELNMVFVVTTAFTTAQDISFGAYVARSFTGVDSGGTAITLTLNAGKQDTSFSTTRVGDMRIATTIALTAGTRTVDTYPFLIRTGVFGNAIGNSSVDTTPWLIGVDNATNPLILRTNEGFIIAPMVTMGAVGVGHLYVQLAWTEVAIGIT
jgi:hypothetical protein